MIGTQRLVTEGDRVVNMFEVNNMTQIQQNCQNLQSDASQMTPMVQRLFKGNYMYDYILSIMIQG